MRGALAATPLTAMFDLVLAGGSVVSPEGFVRADVAIREGSIAAVGEGLAAGATRVVDATGAWVLPGAIDAHVHPIHGETLASVSEAAAAGGVTTVLHHVYPEVGHSMAAWLRERKEEALRGSWVDFGFHARLRADSPDHLRELPAVAALGVRSFKVFMAYRQPGVAVDGPGLREILAAAGRIGGLVLVHAESQAVIESLEHGAPPGEDPVSAYLRTRPPDAETAAIDELAGMARELDCEVYVVHLSSAAALGAVKVARSHGARVIAETCPHYLTFTKELLGRSGARAKIAPPLRTTIDAEALWQGIRSGVVDVVASDHCGYAPSAKEPPTVTFSQAGLGAPGVQQIVPSMLDAAVRGRITPERMVEVLAAGPARIFGLQRKGRVRPGADADLLLVDPGASTTVRADALRGAAYYSLLEGTTLRGRVVTTLLRGVEVGGEAADRATSGRFVPIDPRRSRGAKDARPPERTGG